MRDWRFPQHAWPRSKPPCWAWPRLAICDLCSRSAALIRAPRPASQLLASGGPEKSRELKIEPQGPATREATKPREADFYPRDNYGRDVGVRHEPAFIEPFVRTDEAGNKVGLSGWTAPATPVGSAVSNYEPTGWFALGITFTWGAPPPKGVAPAKSPR